ncbi:MAG: nucleotidyltransferase family protein [Methanobacterium sp.]|uniref:nucleotidyltransferase family protein n=1 Tax=Methanobacterium sp. TaxID=2164 RepID=UPI003D65A023|nr:nucleotidyltransferase family protein [Methanobacterium sp.]
MPSKQEFVRNIIKRDGKLFADDMAKNPVYDEKSGEFKIIADFTEYSPLHKGHKHCMDISKEKIEDGLFVAVVPGLFERSGRGLPYIMTRHARADAAIAVGADIVIEGPPMGIMGSGQYSLCLAKIFKALDADYIPRGYKPVQGFDRILQKISDGNGVAPKPYKIIDMDTKEVLIQGKLHEDNYVIVSLSKSLKKVNFDFKDKFIFVKRIEGVSGTKIREAVLKEDFDSVKEMLPPETIKVLKREINEHQAPLHDLRNDEGIIELVNTKSPKYLKSLALLDDKTVENLINNRPFNNMGNIEKCISRGFSRHYKTRILSSLEAKIDKKTVSDYIEKYPSVIRVLNYKDKKTLKNFKNNISMRRIETWQ